jgi:hypothetical protein
MVGIRLEFCLDTPCLLLALLAATVFANVAEFTIPMIAESLPETTGQLAKNLFQRPIFIGTMHATVGS